MASADLESSDPLTRPPREWRLTGLLLSADGLDRAAERRSEAALIGQLLADPHTLVVEIRGDRFHVVDDEGSTEDTPTRPSPRVRLVTRAPAAADRGRLAVFLGFDHASARTPSGGQAAYLGVVGANPDGEPTNSSTGWRTLRAVGARLDPLDASIVTTLQALANWHRTHPRCSRCGADTEPVQAGWVRRCPVDGSDHFPRTDPSVIMSVIDADDRLLLGRAIGWPDDQFSVLAGFVEAGESLERAVAREVAEEAGVEVEDIRYLGSQPWPFPCSLMLGFTARAVTTHLHHDPVEMAEVRWVTRQEYAALLRAGGIRVPGGISIARRLIERWLGDDVERVAGGTVLEGWRPGVT